MKMPIYLNKIKYQVRHYGKRKGLTVLKEKCSVHSSREVSIGNTLELLNDTRYNNNMLQRLKQEHKRSLGCEINIISVEPIVQCGYTNDRFKDT